MSRLIDADALSRKVKTECNPYGKPTIGFEDGKRVINWIEQAPTIGGWVSVKDRMPERPPAVDGVLVRREWYLVALESGAVLTISYEFDDERWQTVGSPVTHWMPLPEPPPKEGDVECD